MQDLPLKAGWWRISNTSIDVRRCDDHGADKGSGCVGGPSAASCKPSLGEHHHAHSHAHSLAHLAVTTQTHYIQMGPFASFARPELATTTTRTTVSAASAKRAAT